MSGDGGREGSAQERRLLRIAEAITNGARVDWEAERVDGAAAETELANLRRSEGAHV